MTSEASPSELSGNDSAQDMRRLLLVGSAITLPLLLFAMTASIVMIFALRSNVAALEDEARQTKKVTRALQKNLAAVRDAIPEPEPEPPKKPIVTAARRASSAYRGTAGPIKVQAVTPIPVCVFRVGGDNTLAACIKKRTKS